MSQASISEFTVLSNQFFSITEQTVFVNWTSVFCVVSSFWLYFTLRLLLGISAKGLFLCAFMICVEISGVDYKTYLGIMIEVR